METCQASRVNSSKYNANDKSPGAAAFVLSPERDLALKNRTWKEKGATKWGLKDFDYLSREFLLLPCRAIS